MGDSIAMDMCLIGGAIALLAVTVSLDAWWKSYKFRQKLDKMYIRWPDEES